MRRRGVTVLLGALITMLLAYGVFAAPVPYVVLSPGPTVDTLGEQDGKEVIQITGAPTSDSAGQLRLTTVGVRTNVRLRDVILSWFDTEEAVVPRELIYPPGQTREQVEQRNAEDFAASQSSAETAALRELGYPVRVTVQAVTPGGPAEGILQPDDVITSIDGEPVTGTAMLIERIRAKPAGTELTIGYTRGDRSATAKITTAAKDGEPPRIGVDVRAEQPHPFDVTIEVEEIGGPSAGLMFALGIVDKLRPEDLTGGRIIAGSGTIDDLGNVGPIGGIPQKLRGAKAAGATVFLVPEGNCAEAVRNAVDGIQLVKVNSLREALDALRTLREGGQPPLCSAN